MITNRLRAIDALKALKAYHKAKDERMRFDINLEVINLMCDLCHLTHVTRFDPAQRQAQATENFLVELEMESVGKPKA